MFRNLCLLSVLFMHLPMCAKEPLVLHLERDETVSHMAALDDTLAIAAASQERSDSTRSELSKDRSGIVLVRDGVEPVRTPFHEGRIRSLVAAQDGFVAARLVYDKDSNSTAYFFRIDLKGKVTEMPSMEIDLVGMWVGANGEIFSYAPRAVFRWTVANPVWEKLPLDPAVNAEAIRRIVTLKDGSSLVITDRLLKGFKNLQKPPVFVKDLNTYPKPIKAYGDDGWWIVTADDRTQKISAVSGSGDVREVTSLRVVNPHNLLFSGDKVFVVCAREGGNVHKSSYYVLNRDGSGSLRGPFMLPDDTMSTCIWNDAIISGGYSNRVYKTEIER
ncbi:hypothetical protein [Nibricoccus sp. IMCC34717]|uniref:hypothetical protein n=1 Tax=Nibricoccus sp. IMCC34717 TaxID=3034021 RepID=UPI00384F18AD